MKIYQVDAFTNKPFSGNPAGVVLIDTFLEREEMKNIAKEMNLSETAFVKHIGERVYKIMFFTPSDEIDLCGHATLSSAHILYETGKVRKEETITFEANKDTLFVNKKEGENEYSLDFPIYKVTQESIPEFLSKITGIDNVKEYYSTSSYWKILMLTNIDELRSIQPRFDTMKGTEFANIIVTAPGNQTYDYVMRCFVTDCGIPEDPVTGSAECSLAPLWKEKLGKDTFFVAQVSERGGEKKVRLLLDERVQISGEAVTIFEIETKF